MQETDAVRCIKDRNGCAFARRTYARFEAPSERHVMVHSSVSGVCIPDLFVFLLPPSL